MCLVYVSSWILQRWLTACWKDRELITAQPEELGASVQGNSDAPQAGDESLELRRAVGMYTSMSRGLRSCILARGHCRNRHAPLESTALYSNHQVAPSALDGATQI